MPQGKIERIVPNGQFTDDRNQVVRVENNGYTVRAGVPAEFQ